jgi:X-X-X-Leu-X-X-Gly heptad repeat protein
MDKPIIKELTIKELIIKYKYKDEKMSKSTRLQSKSTRLQSKSTRLQSKSTRLQSKLTRQYKK